MAPWILFVKIEFTQLPHDVHDFLTQILLILIRQHLFSFRQPHDARFDPLFDTVARSERDFDLLVYVHVRFRKVVYHNVADALEVVHAGGLKCEPERLRREAAHVDIVEKLGLGWAEKVWPRYWEWLVLIIMTDTGR